MHMTSNRLSSNIKASILLFFLVIIASITDSYAIATSSASRVIGEYRDWVLFNAIQDDVSLCYVISLPKEKTGSYKSRGEPFFMVLKLKDVKYAEVSSFSGYIYNDEKHIKLSIGKKSFIMIPAGDRAWTKDQEDDLTVIDEMIKGDTMVVSSYSHINDTSKDRYSLYGFTDAYKKMMKSNACN